MRDWRIVWALLWILTLVVYAFFQYPNYRTFQNKTGLIGDCRDMLTRKYGHRVDDDKALEIEIECRKLARY